MSRYQGIFHEISGLEEQDKDSVDLVDSLIEKVCFYDAKASTLNKELEAKTKEIEGLQRAAEEMTKEKRDLERSIQEKTQEIEVLKLSVDDKSKQIEELQLSVDEKSKKINDQDMALDKVRAELKAALELNATESQLVNSAQLSTQGTNETLSALQAVRSEKRRRSNSGKKSLADVIFF
jgi:chromosome segregation ATPase